jgi:hypothetical protein
MEAGNPGTSLVACPICGVREGGHKMDCQNAHYMREQLKQQVRDIESLYNSEEELF